MSTISEFNTQNIHLQGGKPEPEFTAQIEFPRSFVAPPRLPTGFRQLDIAYGTNIRAKTIISDVSNTSATYHIATWDGTTLYGGITNSLNLAPANLEFQAGEHVRDLVSDPNAPASTRIDFQHPFLSPPKVVVFLNLIHVDGKRNWRLRTSASDIDERGFTLNLETWDNSILYAARAGWIAYPEDQTHIVSTSVSVQGIKPWEKPSPENSGTITWDNVEFWKTPHVFTAFNMFELGCETNFRLKAYVDNVTQKGLTWHLDTWGDSALFSAGASIIAVN